MKSKDRKKEKRKGIFASLTEQIKKDKRAFLVFAILRLLVIGVLVRSIFLSQWESVFTSSLTLLLLFVPSMLERGLKIEVPTTLEIITYIFVFSAEILGEIECYYMKYPFWDTMLHTVNGFMFAAFGFALVDIFNRHGKFTFKLSPLFCALVAFCFSMTVGVMWEFFEFGSDYLMHLDMQKDTTVYSINSTYLDPEGANNVIRITDIVSTDIHTSTKTYSIDGYLDVGLYDTMADMFVNFVGAVVFSFIGYIYVKQRGRGRIAASFIPKVEPSGE
ncbi:MAG: hypothetical protein IJE84_00265 [Clostridia bacterium]|nr:hypothetical protein [Clostridia bacterium]